VLPIRPLRFQRKPVQTIIINLPSDDARWVDVRGQFQRAGLRPSFHEAVEGLELTPEQCRALYSDRLNRSQYHKPLRPGEIGCYASHIAVWKQLLDSAQRCIAVFEDDIEIDGDLGQVLGAIERLPLDWDLIKLVGRRRERPSEMLPLTERRTLIRYRRLPSLTGAYVLTRRGAEKLLAARQPFGRPVDVDIRHWWECDLQVLGVQPYPVRSAARSRWSTIDDRRQRFGPRERARRLYLQARYSFLNWCARQVARPLGAPAEARFGVREWSHREDAA
jgi:glycosyl transferase family 25